MDIAASSSSAPTVANPAVEKAKEKQRRKIGESISGLKVQDQVEFLISRLAEAEIITGEQRKQADQFRRDNGKLETKLDQMQKMLGKTELSKSKLEQLCRELSKAQREEKELNQLRLKQMQSAHSDTVESFKKSLGEIQQSIDAKQEHGRRMAEVDRLSNSLNQMASDYETRLNELKKLYEERESDLNKISSAKDEELIAMKSHIDEMQKRVQEVFSENVELKKGILASEERLKKSVEAEMALRKMLDEYSHKYSELTKNLSSSNRSFDKVKDQMGKMNGNLIKVQADAQKWKNKAEEANKVATSLSIDKVEAEKLISLKDRQLIQLQELCRRLKKDMNLGGANNANAESVQNGEHGDGENEHTHIGNDSVGQLQNDELEHCVVEETETKS